MKYILVLMLMASAANLSAQYRYEAFSKDGKTGIVTVASLEEVLPPTYPVWGRMYINERYLILRPQSDTAVAFDKMTSKIIKKMPVAPVYPLAKIGGNTYLHARKNGKTVLLDSMLQDRFALQKQYEDCLERNIGSGYLYAVKKDTIDIYRLVGLKAALVQSLAGSYLVSAREYSPQPDKEVYVIYGGRDTYVLDKQMKVARVIHQHASAAYELDVIFNPGQSQASGTSEGPEYPAGQPLAREAYTQVGDAVDGRIRFARANGRASLEMPDNYMVESNDPKRIVVYKVFTTERQGVTSKSMGEKNSYVFVLDEVTGRAILPLKYQEEMGLKIELK